MTYIIEKSAKELDLPRTEGHSPLTMRVQVGGVRNSWAEVVCECGVSVRHQWNEWTLTYLSILRLSWLDGCGREAYLTPPFVSSSRLLWPGEPEPQF